MKPQTCMLISGIVNIIHALLFLLSILALLGIGSLGLIASVDGIHGLVGLTMLVVAVPLLLGLAATGFAGVGVYLAMRGPKNYSSGPI